MIYDLYIQGVSASKLGTADPLTSKTLCLHLPALLPVAHWDLDISPLVQAAALAGLGESIRYTVHVLYFCVNTSLFYSICRHVVLRKWPSTDL